jgi:hypothetical protein
MNGGLLMLTGRYFEDATLIAAAAFELLGDWKGI